MWEYFLVEKLQFDWNEVHAIAEELEHIDSNLLIERLDKYLGNPKFDPHGDPIPDEHGKIELANQTSLVEIKEHQLVKVVAVANQESLLLELLKIKNIGIGTTITIIQKNLFDKSLEIIINNSQALTISAQLAEPLFVLEC